MYRPPTSIPRQSNPRYLHNYAIVILTDHSKWAPYVFLSYMTCEISIGGYQRCSLYDVGPGFDKEHSCTIVYAHCTWFSFIICEYPLRAWVCYNGREPMQIIYAMLLVAPSDALLARAYSEVLAIKRHNNL
jgi:hypothetical protein